jgi:hypothetical protein
LVIGSGFLQSRLLKPFVLFKRDSRYDATLKTFLVSIVLSAIYIWIYKYEMKNSSIDDQVRAVPVMKFFISFALATSFYDLILRLFKFAFKNKTGLDVDDEKQIAANDAKTDSNG